NTYVGGTFSLGWMVKVPRPLNPSPSFGFSAFLGDLADYGVYGHTGFTGTSICIDPIKDIRIIVLTNRVYPTRENQEILRFRRRFHNLVFGQLYSALDDDNGVS
ncbi:MAG TPA: serine hydrolase, partial [Thermoplasmataceae archaeon]|nr:serine hydrolase [Thermoplasmataceae archaeon]